MDVCECSSVYLMSVSVCLCVWLCLCMRVCMCVTCVQLCVLAYVCVQLCAAVCVCSFVCGVCVCSVPHFAITSPFSHADPRPTLSSPRPLYWRKPAGNTIKFPGEYKGRKSLKTKQTEFQIVLTHGVCNALRRLFSSDFQWRRR